MKSKYDIQAEEFLRGCNTTFTSTNLGYHVDKDFDNMEHCRFRCVFCRKMDDGSTKCLQVIFHQSIAKGCKKPSAYEVLCCLQKYPVDTFEDFCSEFGCEEYDEFTGCVNKRSRRIYNALNREYESVFRVFGDVMDELAKIC